MLTLTTSTYSQGEFSKERWQKRFAKEQPVAFKAETPTTGSGLILYSTPSIVTTLMTGSFTDGKFTPNGSFIPGFAYSVNFGRYRVTETSTTYTNWIGAQAFATVGGIGLPDQAGMKASFIFGAAINFSSYGQIGYGYDPISKKGTLVAGVAFPLNVIADGIMATIIWTKPKT